MTFSVARLRAFMGSLFTSPAAGKKLLADNHALRLSNQVLEMLSQHATLPEVFDAMLRIIDNYRPGMSGAVFLVSDSGHELAGCSAPGLPETWLSITAHLPIDELNGPATAAIRSGNTIIIEDAATDPRWMVLREEALGLGINAAWSQPIKNNEGKVLGVFTLYQREAATPDAHDLALLADYARLAQIVVERARLAGALQESQALYRLITENSNDVIWALQYPTWQYSYISPSAERLRGWKPEELSGQNLDELMPPDSLAMCRDILAEHFRRINAGDMTGRFIQFETEVLHREGHSVPIEVVATIMGSPSQPTHIVGSSRDITKRKVAEDALIQAREQLANQLLLSQTLINAIPSPVFAKDSTGRYLMCNREFEEYSGKSREEILGKDVFNTWPRELAQIDFSADNALFSQPHSQVYDAKVPHRDGSLRDVVFNRAVFRDNSGEVAGIIGVMADITERKAAEEAIRNMAFFDQLTGLPNRRMMEDRLAQMLELAKREHRKLALLFVDLDKFKAVNDQHGHQAGDWLLKQVATRMSAVLRTSDTVSRIGGDEFVILLPDIHHTSEAVLVAEKIRAVLEKPFVMGNGAQLDISSSIGVVMYPNQADNMRDLLHSGDEAMYRAKKGGRNAVEVFGSQVREEERYAQYS